MQFFLLEWQVLQTKLKQWDFVISADKIIQYDLDARPLFPQYVIPALNKSVLRCDRELLKIGNSAVNKMIEMKPFLKKNKVKKGFNCYW